MRPRQGLGDHLGEWSIRATKKLSALITFQFLIKIVEAGLDRLCGLSLECRGYCV